MGCEIGPMSHGFHDAATHCLQCGGPRQENAKVSTVGWGRVRYSAQADGEDESRARVVSRYSSFPAMNGQPAVVFHDYLDKGVQVSYTKPDMTVNALFFYSGEGEHSKYTQFAGELIAESLGPAAPKTSWPRMVPR